MKDYSLEPFENRAPPPRPATNEQLLHDVCIPYKALIGKGELPFEKLKQLKNNDVLPLHKESSDLFELVLGSSHSAVSLKGRVVEIDGLLYFQIKK